jgi:multidrug resistance efflux pump
METNSCDSSDTLDFDTIAAFEGAPAEFWGLLSEFALSSFAADAVCLLVGARLGADLRVLAQTPAGVAKRVKAVSEELKMLSSKTPAPLDSNSNCDFVAFTLPGAEGSKIWMVIEGEHADEMAGLAAAKEIRVLCELYLARRLKQRTEQKLLTLSEVMDIGLSLGESHKFGEAALRVCNEVVSQMSAIRVSLAWQDGNDLKLQATSHGGVISKQSEESKALERLMEESLDQDNEVSHPAMAGGGHVIDREHKLFSRAHEDVSVLSVPLRGADGVCGVICVEKGIEDEGWLLPEAAKLRLMSDLFASRLDDLYQKSGWLGRRVWRRTRRRSANLLGPEHTGWKLTGVAVVIALVVAAVVPIEHKIKAPFILKTDAAAVVTAPFAGYIDTVHFHLGDTVTSGQLLVGLDQRELLLQRADTLAGRNKSSNEARSYEAEGKLAEMRVAVVHKEQADARLAIIDHRLAQTKIRAPFDGVVVEGELREKLSSPVQVGEALFKIVQLRDLFGQLQVDERDVSYLQAGFVGEIAFSSRPSEKYSVLVDRFEPVAEVRSEGTIFLLRAQIDAAPQDWWRPGVGGICKIHAGKRSILWVATHRLVEVIRLWTWI